MESQASKSIIEVQGVSKRYGRTLVLDDVSLAVRENEPCEVQDQDRLLEAYIELGPVARQGAIAAPVRLLRWEAI